MTEIKQKIYEHVLENFFDLEDSDQLRDMVYEVVDKIYNPNIDIMTKFYYSFSYWGAQKYLLSDEDYQMLKEKELKEAGDLAPILKKFIDKTEDKYFDEENYPLYLTELLYSLYYKEMINSFANVEDMP